MITLSWIGLHKNRRAMADGTVNRPSIGQMDFLSMRFLQLVIEVAIIVGIGYAYGASHELVKDLRWLEIGIAVVLTLALVVVPIFVARYIERRQSAA